jgi:hypothetical protein
MMNAGDGILENDEPQACRPCIKYRLLDAVVGREAAHIETTDSAPRKSVRNGLPSGVRP